jgi:enamine deaminase RidA (YjgF/YER057c/UK114 family)
MSDPEKRLREMGLELPPPPDPIAQYVSGIRVGQFVFISGQGPIREGRPVFIGRVGAGLKEEDGYQAARLCALNCLAVAKMLLGSLSMVERIIHIRGFINSDLHFTNQPAVLNGASDLVVHVFGDAGRHARAALGTSVLPGNIPVEIEMILKARPEAESE